MNLVLAGIEIVEETLGVKRAAGSGDGDKYSQGRRMLTCKRAKYGCGARVGQGAFRVREVAAKRLELDRRMRTMS